MVVCWFVPALPACVVVTTMAIDIGDPGRDRHWRSVRRTGQDDGRFVVGITFQRGRYLLKFRDLGRVQGRFHGLVDRWQAGRFRRDGDRLVVAGQNELVASFCICRHDAGNLCHRVGVASPVVISHISKSLD